MKKNIIYIGSDEEIISIVNKVKMFAFKEVVLVVQKGAILFQGIVNLKILKREAEKNGKKIIIATQDQRGKVLSAKAGIVFTDFVEVGEKAKNDSSVLKQMETKKEKLKISEEIDKKKFLNKLGTENFFQQKEDLIDSLNYLRDSRDKSAVFNFSEKKKDFSREIIPPEKKFISVSPKESFSKVVSQEKNYQNYPMKNYTADIPSSPTDNFFQPSKEEEIQRLFASRSPIANNKKSEAKTKKSYFLKKTLKILSFVILLVVVVAGVFYIMRPRAEIDVVLERFLLEKNFSWKGILDERDFSSFSENDFHFEMIQEEGEITLSFPVTGKKTISDKKARGMITIYNESSSAQKLVATTRFLSKDGKIFRLVEGVIVPEMKIENGKAEPGSIDVEVVADEAGEEFNIGASVFSIPGLSGSPKHEKIYAKSVQAMKGGGLSGEEVSVVTQKDIDIALEKTQKELEKTIVEKIKAQLGEEKIILEESLEKDIISSSVSPSVGLPAEEIQCQMVMKIKTVTFSREKAEQNLIVLLKKELNENPPVAYLKEMDLNEKNFDLNVDYEKINWNEEKKEAEINVFVRTIITPSLNVDNLKKSLAGKKETETKKIFDEYPQIKKIELGIMPDLLPQALNKIPEDISRISVNLKEE